MEFSGLYMYILVSPHMLMFLVVAVEFLVVAVEFLVVSVAVVVF